jgi:predicted glycosyltransferase
MDLTEGTGWWLLENLLPLWKEYKASVDKENRERDEWGREQNRRLVEKHMDEVKVHHEQMFPGIPMAPNLWGWATTSANFDGFLTWLANREVPDGLE